MLSTKQASYALHLIIPVFIAIFSIFVLSGKVPELRFMTGSVENLEESKETVMEFAGVTVATSLAISALPDDFATPLADNFADMNRYFVFILIALFIERLIVVEGTKIAFLVVIPVACGIYLLSIPTKRDFLKKFSIKLSILGIALVLVVPCSTHLTNLVADDYLVYVNETIKETGDGADKINEEMSTGDEDKTIFEKLSDAFKTAIKGVTDLLTYFNNEIKKCMNSIAILIVTTVVMPLLTLLFFKWLLKELFSIKLSFSGIGGTAKGTEEHAAIEEKKE